MEILLPEPNYCLFGPVILEISDYKVRELSVDKLCKYNVIMTSLRICISYFMADLE